MAEARIASCPNCGHNRETKAQPRTVLKCPECAEHYLAPPLAAAGDPAPAEAEPSTGDGLPVASDAEVEGLLGPEVVRVDAVDFPAAEVHPSAAGDPPAPDPDPPPDPAPVSDDSPAAPAPNPAAPTPPAGTPPRSPGRRRRRGYARW